MRRMRSQWLMVAVAFGRKIGNDWVPLLASELTYRLLLSAFAILLVIVAIGGLLLGAISPAAHATLNARLAASLPMQNGAEVVAAVTTKLQQSAGVLLVVALAAALYTGSRLFVTLEKSFALIFRVRCRRPLQQNLMAVGMLLLYALLIPVLLMASLGPSVLVAAFQSVHVDVFDNPLAHLLVQGAGVAATGLAALLLFGSIYVIVPNLPLRPKEVWKGTVISAVLLVLDSALFPFYVHVVLRPQSRGSIVGLLVVVLAYYFFQAYILLLGAEVNAWAYGIQAPIGRLDAVVHEAHTLSAAGAWPLASEPASAIEKHLEDARPLDGPQVEHWPTAGANAGASA